MFASAGKWTIVMLCGVAVLAPAATADPGQPDTDGAAAGVYEGVTDDEVLGETTPPEVTPTVELGDEPTTQPGPPTQPVADEPVGDEGGGVVSLPLTGFAATLVLGLALMLLTGGGLLRWLARRPGAA